MKEMRKLNNKGSKRRFWHPHQGFTSKELLLDSNFKNPNKTQFWCCIFLTSNHRKSETPPSYKLNFADSAYGSSQYTLTL